MNGTRSMLGKQAKALSPNQIKAVLLHLGSTRNPERNRVAFLLSVKAGLRAKEVASISWAMVTTSEGRIAEVISLHDIASKGSSGGSISKPAVLEITPRFEERISYPTKAIKWKCGVIWSVSTLWLDKLSQNSI